MSIALTGVRVDLPVYSSNSRSLRKLLTKATVGGALLSSSDSRVFVRALDNVSFTVNNGDRLGLVGGNGAGKTTLLKVLAGVITPDQGTVDVQGRVSAALNVGLGLDPETTGRENIFLLGYFRGFSKEAIERSLDSIIQTADLGNFINLPVSTYSSGMLGRLTFAVATAFEPDVLLMDEWLLAGDAAFMDRAFSRTTQFVNQARILVLATHSVAIMREFCNRCLYLRAGQVVAAGETEEVLAQYEADVHAGHLRDLEAARR